MNSYEKQEFFGTVKELYLPCKCAPPRELFEMTLSKQKCGVDDTQIPLQKMKFSIKLGSGWKV